MFTKKAKRNYQTAVWTLVVICLCILIIYFAWPNQPVEKEAVYQNPDYVPSSETSAESKQNIQIEDFDEEDEEDDGSDRDDETDENLSENEENSINDRQDPYYLVKRAGNEIAVFFCDAHGNMVQLETTEILYEMLGPDDQMLFDQGIRINSQEELSVLLQDFEG